MIALTTTQRQLELDLTASSSVPISIIVCFRDIRYATGQIDSYGEQLSNSNGTSDVIICSPPTAGVLRLIETVTISNSNNGSSVTARVYYDENGTEYDIVKVTLSSGDTLMYEDD